MAAGAVIVGACQPETRRVLILDLALSEPGAVAGTAAPWQRAGYHVDYRRFYPHPTRADAGQYRVLLLLTGRTPEAPSDALRPSDLEQLATWVRDGGVLVAAYAGDGEGGFDRWMLNRWLAALHTGIAIGDSVLRDTTPAQRAGNDPQPWVTPRNDGPVRGGGLLSFPGGRNHALSAPPTAVLANAMGAPVLAAVRLGDGLLIVGSRHVLGALGPELRTSTAPFLAAAELERTRTFLVALARWTRRPAEWAQVPPTRRPEPIDLAGPPRVLSGVPTPDAPPAAVATDALEPAPAATDRPGLPAWTRRQGFRVLRDDGPLRPGLVASARARMLDSLVEFMEAAALTALWTRAAATPLADTTRSQQWERDLTRAVWKQIAERMQTTSVRWLVGIDLHDSRLPRDTFELDARGDTVAPWAALDPRLWDEALRPSARAIARLASEQQELITGIVFDLPAYGMASGFADPTFRAGLAALPGDSAWKAALLAAPAAARYDTLLERGYVPAFFAALEDAVAQRATALRADVRRYASGRGFGLRVSHPTFDWFTRGMIRGLGDSTAAVWLFTDEARTAPGVSNVTPVLRLTGPAVPPAAWHRLADVAFGRNSGFWLDPISGAAAPDSLARMVRRLVREARLPEAPARR